MLPTNQPLFPTTNAWVESPPEFWALALKASRGFVWRIVGLDASYVLHIDLLAVLCWTGAVWTEQRSCLNDLAALCTIIHLTGGSQCPAEGLHLLWPLALHSDKGTSIEYFWDPQHMYIDVQYVAAYWFWTSLFHCEKETLCYDNMWISRVTFKWLQCYLSCLLPTWQCYYETDAVIFPSTLVTLANPSAPARPLSLFAANSFGKLTLFKEQNPCSLSEVAQPHCGCYILCVTPASGDLKLQVETTSLSA